MSNELTLQEAALAWAQGKRVEAIHKTLFSERWTKVEPAGTECSNTYSAGVFGDCAGKYRFRLAPQPPAKKWRPWTPEEVPVGAVVRTARTGQPFRWLIVAVCSDGITTCGGSACVTQKHQWLMDSCEYSPDNGKTWLPCGVEVEA